jgi:outer membrane protein TolC
MPLTPTLISSGDTVATTQNLFTTGIAYNVPLFTGFAQTREIEINDIVKQMSTAKASLTKEQLIYNIRSLYLSVLAQEEIAMAQRSYTHALKKLTAQIAYEVKIGKKAKIDLLKVQSDLRASQTQQEILVSNIEITKATLSSLVGKNIGSLSPLNIKVRKPYYSVNKLYEQVSGLTKVEMEDMALSKADKKIAQGESAKLPQLNLTSYVGKNYGEDLASKDWENETLWQVGVSVKWNLVDFGKRDLSVQQAKIAKMEAIFNKEQTLLDLRKLLTQGVEKIKQSYGEYLGNSAELRLLEKSESIEKVRYENDAATLNDLLLAKGKKQLASAKLIESKYNYKKSIYYLDYLLERGMDQ